MLLLWFFGPTIAVLAVGLVGVHSLVSWRTARDARDATATLLSDSANAVDGTTRLRGRLVIDGEPCAAPEGLSGRCGAHAKWASPALRGRSTGRIFLEGGRAGALAIESSDGRVLLEGPLEVVVGSRARWVGMRARDASFEFHTALFEGDEVVAVGLWRARSSGDAAGDSYRTTGESALAGWEGARLAIAATEAPRTRAALGTLLTSTAMWPCYVVALFVGATVMGQQWVRESPQCRAAGHCTNWFHTTDDADCRAASQACLASGRCFAEDGRCVARSEEDCHLSLFCIVSGDCSLTGDRCQERLVDGPDDCADDPWLEAKASDGCTFEERTCAGGSPSSACKKWKSPPLISRSDCIAAECAESCAESAMCMVYGHCAPSSDGRFCVATADGCAASERCRERGVCGLLEGSEHCSATSAEACAASVACTQFGWCHPMTYELFEDRYNQVCFIDSMGRSWISEVPPDER